MKKYLTTALLIFSSIFCNAQNWELKVNAGANTTFVNGIQSFIGVFTRPKDPYNGPITLDPGTTTISATSHSDMTAQNKIGYYADGELIRHLSNNWALSVSLGINKISYNYDMAISEGSTTTNIQDLEEDYGKSRFLYANSRFLNVSKSFSSLSLSAGPVLSLLLHNKKFNNAFTTDKGNNTITTVVVPNPRPAKFLYGGNLTLGYKLARPLELKAGTQYFFNSVYKKGENVNSEEKDIKVNPFQITLGLSYSLLKSK